MWYLEDYNKYIEFKEAKMLEFSIQNIDETLKF